MRENCSSRLSFIGRVGVSSLSAVVLVLAHGDYDSDYNRALALLQGGNPEQSRLVVNELLVRDNRAELHNLLGEIEEVEKHPQQSAEQYEIAARMDSSEKNLFDLGNELLLHRGFEPALKVFTFATAQYPRSAPLRVGLGIAFYSLGQYSNAIDELCRAVDLAPRDARALDFLGKMYDVAPEKQDDVSRHLALFAREYPDNAAANYYYALSLRRRTSADGSRDDNRKAEALLRRAALLRPDWADTHYELGLLYEDGTRIPEAIAEYQLAAKLAPQLAPVHYRLARLYEKEGRHQLAQSEFRALAALKH